MVPTVVSLHCVAMARPSRRLAYAEQQQLTQRASHRRSPTCHIGECPTFCHCYGPSTQLDICNCLCTKQFFLRGSERFTLLLVGISVFNIKRCLPKCEHSFNCMDTISKNYVEILYITREYF